MKTKATGRYGLFVIADCIDEPDNPVIIEFPTEVAALAGALKILLANGLIRHTGNGIEVPYDGHNWWLFENFNDALEGFQSNLGITEFFHIYEIETLEEK